MLLLLLVAFGQRALAANAAPTLSHVNTLTGPSQDVLGSEDSDIFISYAVLKEAANELDVDSSTINFQIIALQSGSLAIRPAGSSSSGSSAVGQTLDSNEELVWHPATNVSGDVIAFTVFAFDGATNSSAPAVSVTVRVAPLNDAPTFTYVTTLTGAAGAALGNEDGAIVISYALLQANANEADVDVGDTVNFQITTITNGTLKIRAANTTGAGTAVTNNQTFTSAS